MYWEYFGFKEPPFALTPNPAFLFLSSPHQEAFAHLLFAIENRVGFIELSGEVGAGKTTLVRTLLNQLEPESHRTALIFNPTLSPLGLLQEVNAEFGVACEKSELRELHQALNRFLLEENRAGRTVVLVIDEAQNLSVEVLEQIRLISNLETDSEKLIQIVLVGQPELQSLLERPDLRQLDQRITVRYHLPAMGFADSCAYIRHRISFAAEGREPLAFSAGALKRIYRYSGGLPRLINGACDRALLLAYTRGCREVSPAMAAAALADLHRERGSRRRGRLGQALAASLFIALLAYASFQALPLRRPAAAKTAAARPEAPPLTRELAFRELAARSEQQNLYAALNAVLSAWGAPALTPAAGEPATLKSLAQKRGMLATGVSGSLDTLQRLDAPALLQVTVPGAGRRLVALTALDQEGGSVTPALAGRNRLSRSELAQIWNGGATVLWKDFESISTRAKRGEKVAGVKRLQGLLKQVGCYDGPLNGRGGDRMRAAVIAFQKRERMQADGEVGEKTLLLLYRRAGGFFPPGLSRAEGTVRGDNGHAGRNGGTGRNG